jgi:hypothetical protein
VNSGCVSIRSMMRRSGVNPRAYVSKVVLETPRRAASDHRDSMQFGKFCAAARIASVVIKGWPELPGCPLHSGAPPGFGPGTEPVTTGAAGAAGPPGDCVVGGVVEGAARNGNHWLICAAAGKLIPAAPISASAAQTAYIRREPIIATSFGPVTPMRERVARRGGLQLPQVTLYWHPNWINGCLTTRHLHAFGHSLWQLRS